MPRSPVRAPEAPRATPAPRAATPPPPQRDRPVRKLSFEELRQLTGASEDELDIPTFLRNND
jgi:hypothetical protein